MSYEEIAAVNPVEFAKRDQDKLRYRYPHGESYIDVCKYVSGEPRMDSGARGPFLTSPLAPRVELHP
jgi:hypothetical protein